MLPIFCCCSAFNSYYMVMPYSDIIVFMTSVHVWASRFTFSFGMLHFRHCSDFFFFSTFLHMDILTNAHTNLSIGKLDFGNFCCLLFLFVHISSSLNLLRKFSSFTFLWPLSVSFRCLSSLVHKISLFGIAIADAIIAFASNWCWSGRVRLPGACPFFGHLYRNCIYRIFGKFFWKTKREYKQKRLNKCYWICSV